MEAHAAPLREILERIFEQIDKWKDRHDRLTGLETGYYDLDELTSGFQPGEMIVLAARPSVGKSTLALNIAEHVAVDLNQPVAFFSLEMSKEELSLRLLSSRAEVDGQRLRKGALSEKEARHTIETAHFLSGFPLYVDDTPGLRVLDLRAKARRLAVRHGIQLVLIDYLQLMSAPGAENRQVEVANISRGIKALARELRVPVVAVAQLRRESVEHKRPRLSDLRESGAIEQDADVVMLMNRVEEEANLVELIIAKQRNGPTGILSLTWQREFTRFRPFSPREAVGPVRTTEAGHVGEAPPEPEVPF
jgi:replicative DNA helicase